MSLPARPKILIIDDEPLIRDLYSEILESENYDRFQACNGIEALEIWHNHYTSSPFSLLVVDLKMPQMGGEEFIEEIRKIDALIPIIMITGHGDLNHAYSLLKKYNISDFLQKPLKSYTQLLFSVKNALEKYQLHQELTTLNAELEQRVETRTHELQYAKELAETASNAKSLFLSRMSHEFLTPLHAIIGFAEIQKISISSNSEESNNKENGPKKTNNDIQSIEQILRAGDNLRTLINEILDVVNLDKKQNNIHLVERSIDNIVHDSITQMSPMASNNNIFIHYKPTVLYALTDEKVLTQILIHLLSNAIKFNHTNGNVIIDIEKGDNDTIIISIRDTGIGILAEELDIIYAPFKRLDYAEKSAIPGTGIGLTLVKKLAVQINGEIGAYSTPNKGSTFWIKIPANQDWKKDIH